MLDYLKIIVYIQGLPTTPYQKRPINYFLTMENI